MENLKIKIQELRINDYESIVDLWKKAGLPIKEGWRDRKDQIEKQFQSGHMNILGLYIGDELVATAMLTDDSRKAWINRVAVLPEHRGKGYAVKLIEEAEKNFKEREFKIICCQIEDYNKSSLELFKKVGYKEFEGIHYLTKRESEDV